MIRITTAVALTALTAGCIQREPVPPTPPAPQPEPVLSQAGLYEITHTTSIEGVGTAQGIFAEGNFFYVLGSLSEGGTAGPGVIREFFQSRDDDRKPTLYPSDRVIRLTENGQDVISTPTGLTWHPNFGYWLGGTQNGAGRLIQIDFERAIRQGTLDGCILHQVEDDAAVNGTRPLFLTLPGGRVTLVSSDDGDAGNAIRFYDPVALLGTDRTSTLGVLTSEAPCGQFVQSLTGRGAAGQFWLVQTQSAGTGYRLTQVEMDDAGEIVSENTVDFDRTDDGLKGLLWLTPDRDNRVPFIMVSSGERRNVHFGRLQPPQTYTNPVQRQINR